MTAVERFRRLEQLFERARCLGPSQRRDLLERDCARDATLRRDVEVLLVHHDSIGRAEIGPAQNVTAQNVTAPNVTDPNVTDPNVTDANDPDPIGMDILLLAGRRLRKAFADAVRRDDRTGDGGPSH